MATKANRQRAAKKAAKQPEVPAYISPDPLGDLCGQPFSPIAIYAMSAAIAFAGGLGIGWAVWA